MSRKLLGLIPACLLALAAGAACQPVPPPPGIVFVGDSITALSTADIHAHYDPAYTVSVRAAIGLDTFLSTGNVAAAAATNPAVAVIDLGTNDADRMGQDFGPLDPAQSVESVTARLDGFAAQFPASTCVIFVTVNTHNPSWGAGVAAQLDDHVRTFAHVADWDAATTGADYDVADNPHPNAAGRQHLLTVEDQAIAGCPKAGS